MSETPIDKSGEPFYSCENNRTFLTNHIMCFSQYELCALSVHLSTNARRGIRTPDQMHNNTTQPIEKEIRYKNHDKMHNNTTEAIQ